jgi:hypothetical protein
LPSPSHMVGLERFQRTNSVPSCPGQVAIPHGGLRTYRVLSEFIEEHRSSSHTVGLELSNSYWNYGRTYTSPSHTVGSELPRGGASEASLLARKVAIPRGGLGKRVLDDFVGRVLLPTSSPSHTVGLELGLKPLLYIQTSPSPSHTVGSERGQGDSIPAGRETGGGASVSIPHSGLGTKQWHYTFETHSV